MKYSEQRHYPFPAADMLRAYTHPDFFLRKYAAQGARDIEVLTLKQQPEQFSIKVSRKVPVEVAVPAFARSLVPTDITLIQTDSWDVGSGRGRLEIAFQGMPVLLTCDMRIISTAEGSQQDLDFDIRVSVPLIGGKLEKLLAEDLQLKFARDTEVTRALVGEFF